MATRMMQSLQVVNSNRPRSEKDEEIYNRTYWGCFVMDRLVYCGKSQPLSLPLDKMSIHLPIGEQDFAFGSALAPRRSFRDLVTHTMASGSHDTINNCYSVLVTGFDIWARVLEFVGNGGRRQPGRTAPKNCPWVHGSPWRSIYDTLEDWRSRQSERLKYPSSSIAVHVSLGNGESFTFVNLIYYVRWVLFFQILYSQLNHNCSILFLNREYIPFLPNTESEPQGPVDLPHLQAVAPDGWWKDRAQDLFQAAACITEMLHELSLLDSRMFTPFTGFCVFSAATMNIYIAAFPRMNLGRSHNAAALAEISVKYLDEFKGFWKMGNGWVSLLRKNFKICADT